MPYFCFINFYFTPNPFSDVMGMMYDICGDILKDYWKAFCSSDNDFQSTYHPMPVRSGIFILHHRDINNNVIMWTVNDTILNGNAAVS